MNGGGWPSRSVADNNTTEEKWRGVEMAERCWLKREGEGECHFLALLLPPPPPTFPFLSPGLSWPCIGTAGGSRGDADLLSLSLCLFAHIVTHLVLMLLPPSHPAGASASSEEI